MPLVRPDAIEVQSLFCDSSIVSENIPASVPTRLGWPYLADFFLAHSSRHVAFIFEHEKTGTCEPLLDILISQVAEALIDSATHLFQQQAVKLVSAISHSVSVGRIDHPDQGVCLLEIVLPIRSKRLLATDIPYASSFGVADKNRRSGADPHMFSL